MMSGDPRSRLALAQCMRWTLAAGLLLLSGCFEPVEDEDFDTREATGDASECPEGAERNPCGGCEPLAEDVGTPCGSCETGVWACEGDGTTCAGDLGLSAGPGVCGPDALCLEGVCLPLAPCESDADCPLSQGYACNEGRCEIPEPLACLPVQAVAIDNGTTAFSETPLRFEITASVLLRPSRDALPGEGPWAITWVTVEAPVDADIAERFELSGMEEDILVALEVETQGTYRFRLAALEDSRDAEACSDDTEVVFEVTGPRCGEAEPVAFETDVRHCGACGIACSFPNATAGCDDGACVVASCPTHFGNCDDNPATGCETSTRIDNNNCGDCGNVCGAGFSCVSGSCVRTSGCDTDSECETGEVCDDGACVPLNACGGTAVLDGQLGGTCGPCGFGALTCAGPDTLHCQGEVDLASDPQNCGSCATICTAGFVCTEGACAEDAPCIPDCSGLACGDDGCGGSCGLCESTQLCEEGACCSPNACGACVLLEESPGTPCGVCGTWVCDAASGGVECNDPGLNACGGCALLEGSPNDACGPCAGGVLICAGEDALTCDGDDDLTSDPNNCGACGRTCSTDQVCVDGACVQS